MAYQAGGTDYAGFARQRAQADEGLTRALDAKGRADKQKRIKKSGERSGLAKLVSAGVRGAAAYYSGGLSEQMGAGGMIDSAMLGTDSEGRAVRNEYGDLVGAGSQLYSASKSMKAGKLGEQDAKFDKLMDRRQKNVKMLFDAGMKDEGMAAQSAMEDMRLKYEANRKDAEGKGWGGSGFGMSDEDYNIQPEAMTSGQRAARVSRLNRSEADVAREQAIIGDEGRRQQGQTTMPAKADAPAAPDLSQVGNFERPAYETQRAPEQSKISPLEMNKYFGGEGRGAQPVSVAQAHEMPQGSPGQIQKAKHKAEQDDLIERITGGENRRQQSQLGMQ